MESCFDESPVTRTALFRIDVIEIPIDNPAASKIVQVLRYSPTKKRVLVDYGGGDHGEETQDTRATDECHDITVFVLNIAGKSRTEFVRYFDPMNPAYRRGLDSGFAYWHPPPSTMMVLRCCLPMSGRR